MFTQVSENPTKEEDHTFFFKEIDAEMDAPVLEGHCPPLNESMSCL
jgi:hypothetical protein